MKLVRIINVSPFHFFYELEDTMANKKLISIDEFKSVPKDSPFLLLKHSTTCSISENAFEEWEAFIQDHPNVMCYYLFVQEARDLSTFIAEQYEVKHESPQLLLFKDGKVIWHDSHWKITYSTMQMICKEYNL
jgi:bacillithiol system protein YtxJ